LEGGDQAGVVGLVGCDLDDADVGDAEVGFEGEEVGEGGFGRGVGPVGVQGETVLGGLC